MPKEILQAAQRSNGSVNVIAAMLTGWMILIVVCMYVCMYVSRASDGISLAQKKKNMSNIPLLKKKRDPNRTVADEDGDQDSDSAQSDDEQEVLQYVLHNPHALFAMHASIRVVILEHMHTYCMTLCTSPCAGGTASVSSGWRDGGSQPAR